MLKQVFGKKNQGRRRSPEKKETRRSAQSRRADQKSSTRSLRSSSSKSSESQKMEQVIPDLKSSFRKAGAPMAATNFKHEKACPSTPQTEDVMSDATDMSSSSSRKMRRESEPTSPTRMLDGVFSSNDREEVDQMRQLAESLGLPASFFGIEGDENKEENSNIQDLNKSQQHQSGSSQDEEAPGTHNQPSDEENETHSEEIIMPKTEQEVPAATPEVQEQSISSCPKRNDQDEQVSARKDASDGANDVSPHEFQSPVRRDFKPQPTTIEQKKRAKEDAMTRLNRIKAKAVKSATKTLGVDEHNLSYAVGLSNDTQEARPPIKKNSKSSTGSNMDDPEEIQKIADALGLPIEMFGVMPHQATTKPSSGEMPSEEDKRVIEIVESDGQQGSQHLAQGENTNDGSKSRSVEEPMTSPVSKTVHTVQPGSLAAALGVPTDTTSRESNSVGSVQTSSVYSNSFQEEDAVQPGSLAAALGFSAVQPENSSSDAPTSSAKPSSSGRDTKVQDSLTVKPGSLAAALGFSGNQPMQSSVEAPSKPSSSGRDTKVQDSSTVKPGSLAAALGFSGVHPEQSSSDAPISSTKSSGPGRDVKVQDSSTVQPGSLAAALGFSGVHPEQSSSYAPISSTKSSGPGRDVKVQDSSTVQPGSLAAALGFSGVHPEQSSSYAPISSTKSSCPGRDVKVQDSSTVQPGSLAAALGFSGVHPEQSSSYAPTSSTKPRRSGRDVKVQDAPTVQPGSLAAALAFSAVQPDRSSSDAPTSSTKPPSSGRGAKLQDSPTVQPGSLAAALGCSSGNNITCGPDGPTSLSNNYSQERNAGQGQASKTISQPRAGSLAAALGLQVGETEQTFTIQNDPSNSDFDDSSSDGSDDSEDFYKDESTGNQTDRPKAGSLAAALGMQVSPDYDPSQQVRGNEKSSLTSAVLTNVVADAKRSSVSGRLSTRIQETAAAQPRNGTLVDALQIPINKEGSVPSDTQVSTTSSCKGLGSEPAAGSLAAALGARVVESFDAAGSQGLDTRSSSSEMHVVPNPGSLAAALGLSVAVEDQSSAAKETASLSREMKNGHPKKSRAPTAGSLAAALGMAVADDAPTAPLSPALGHVPRESTKPLAGSLAAALDIQISEESTPREGTIASSNSARDLPSPRTRAPVAGSLVAVLGIQSIEDAEGITAPAPAPPMLQTSESSPVPMVDEARIAPGSLAAALGITGTSTCERKLPNQTHPDDYTTAANRSAKSTTPMPVERPSYSQVFTDAPFSDPEIRLRIELAAAKSEVAAAKAYGKALEEQMSQMAKAYSDKLAGLQQQVAMYESELEAKSRELEAAQMQHQERAISFDQDEKEDEMLEAQEALMQRLCLAAERMTRTRNLMDEADSMLQTEINEIRTIKSEYEKGYNDDTESSTSSTSSTGASQTRASQDLQMKLDREEDRRKSIKSRLQAMRDANAN